MEEGGAEAPSMTSWLLPIRGLLQRAGHEPQLCFPQCAQGGRGFRCHLLLEAKEKPGGRGLLSPSEAENGLYEVQPSKPRGTYARGAPTCSIWQSSPWECSQHQRLIAAYMLKLTVSLDGWWCNNFALCVCRCFYPHNPLGR